MITDEFPSAVCGRHDNDIQNLQKDVDELFRYHDGNVEKLDRHKEEINALKNNVYGIDGQDGIRHKVNKLEHYIDVTKPEHNSLMEKLNEFNALKKGLSKLIYILIATLALTLFTNYLKIQTDNSKVKTLESIQTELTKVLATQLKTP